MKIKISDMLDNAAELIETEGNCDNTIDSKRVKEIVFQRIHKSQKRKIGRQCAVFLIAVLVISGISVGAKALLRSAGVIGKHQHEVLQPQKGIKTNEDDELQNNTDFEVQTDLIKSDNFYKDGVPIAKYVEEIPVEEDILPECYLDNGTMLIFTRYDAGWYADTDTILQLDFQQRRVEETEPDRAGTLEVGYVYNGDVKWFQTSDSISNSVQFMFDEEGEYNVCVRNISSDRVIITNGFIYENKNRRST